MMTWSSRWVEDLREEMGAVTEEWTIALDPRWRMHDLRHTVATVMTESLGPAAYDVENLTGRSLAELLEERQVFVPLPGGAGREAPPGGRRAARAVERGLSL